MSRTRIIGGKLTEIVGGDHNIYSASSIITNSAKTITETGVEKGVTYGEPENAPNFATGQINAQATVMFRPTPSWKGEFMFDWMRTGNGTNLGQTSLAGDVDYQTILGTYNNNAVASPFVGDTRDTNSNGVKDLYEKLISEYRKFTSLNRLDTSGASIDYLEPKLCIYKNENESADAVAILQLQIEVIVAPDELILEYENDFFDITVFTGAAPVAPSLLATPAANAPAQPEDKMKQLQMTKTVTGASTFNTIDIQIKCKKTFATAYKEIKAYTIMADPNPAITTKVRKLAGTLKVLPNSASKRKIKKIVLVNVITDIDNAPINTVEEGFLVAGATEAGQKNIIRKYLRQALIDPIFSMEILDLTSVNERNTTNRDSFNRTYVVGGRLKCYHMHGATEPRGWNDLDDYLYTQLKAKVGVGNKYDNYIRIFYMPQGGFYMDANNTQGPVSGSLGGFTSGSDPNNIVMLKGADLTTSAHEVYHSLKLPHTWESKNHINPIYNSETNTERNGKHSFKEKTTRNLMDYGPNSAQYFLYHWQCVIANSNAIAEPANYIPAP